MQSQAFFKHCVSLLLDAQTQIIGLMELAKHQMLVDPMTELRYETDQITMFLQDVRQYLKMLEPFANILGQTNSGGLE